MTKKTWLGIWVGLILALALWLDYPTFKALLNLNPSSTQEQLQQKKAELDSILQELEGLGLALVDLEKKQIRILMEPERRNRFPLQTPLIQSILQNQFITVEEDDQLFLKLENQNTELFLSDITQQLNELLQNIKKIIKIELTKDSILVHMKPGRRLNHNIEPAKSWLGDDLEWFYIEEQNWYQAKIKPSDHFINLGLDLQGGAYLDIGIETEQLQKEILNKHLTDIEDWLINQNTNFESITLDGEEIIIEVDSGLSLDLENEELANLTLDFEVDAGSPPIYRLELTSQAKTQIQNDALNQVMEVIRNRIDQLGVKEPTIQKQGQDSIIIQLPGQTDSSRAIRLIKQAAVLEFRLVVENSEEESVSFNQEIRDSVTKEIINTQTFSLNPKPLLKGSEVKDARVAFGANFGSPQVTVTFDTAGAATFADITTNHVGKQLAIVLDGKVQSTPVINEPILGGQASISGNFTVDEATDLALVLRSGALSAPIVINEQRTVGASLGEDSIRQSLAALLFGLSLVVLFMIFYYSLSGFLSVLALVYNILLLLSVLAYFGATLTLPGMAGIILTIGMAVDANALIFERIREEIARNTEIVRAIKLGFQKATLTIADANITTLLAAIVLFQFGTGPIKGFAVTLSVGIGTSMFCSLVVTRYLMYLIYLNKKRQKIWI